MECVGAPVFGPDGSVVGALSVSSLYKPTEDYEQLGRLSCQKGSGGLKIVGFSGQNIRIAC